MGVFWMCDYFCISCGGKKTISEMEGMIEA
jgi:hypothetical protein